MKKVFILYLAYYAVAVIQGCCGKADCIPYINLSGGVLRVAVNGHYEQVGTHIVTGDTLHTELDFIHEFTAKRTPDVQLMSTAYAFRCDACDNGDRGLKDKVVQLSLTSNQTYNGIAAGNSLNSLFKVEDQQLYTTNNIYFQLDSLGFIMNSSGVRNKTPFNIISGTKPGNLLLHKLNMKLTFQSGKVLNAVTPEFRWN